MNRNWLERVRQACARRGLPRPRIERMVEELEDHLADLAADATVESSAGGPEVLADERLGSPDQLASAAVANLRARSFAARHPAWTFLALPIPITILGWGLLLTFTLCLFHLGGELSWLAPLVKHRSVAEWPWVLLYVVPVLEFATRTLPPVAIAILFCRWSRTALYGPLWSIASCMLVAAIFGTLRSTLELPLEPNQGRWSLALLFPGGREQVLQFALPLMVAVAWLAHRARGASRLTFVRPGILLLRSESSADLPRETPS
jgi:hypothetical protein